jgi:hypothetical protein
MSLIAKFLMSVLAFASTSQPAVAEEVVYTRHDRPPIAASEVERAIQESLDEFNLRPRESFIREIMDCESDGNPYATNGSHDGVFSQSKRFWRGRVEAFNRAMPHYPVSGDAFNAFDNIRVSFRFMAAGKWSHWAACLP